VPIDFSGATRSLVAHAKHWAETFGATVSFLHVVGRQDSSTPTRDEPPPAQNDPQTTNARSRLAATVEATEGPDVNTDTRVLTGGDVASRIVQYAETQRARFLLMAAHGLSNLRRYLLGGVTDRVIRRAPCPVCTLKSYEQSLITTT
jgi:nucleotide-binding universal stress UspA family protein